MDASLLTGPSNSVEGDGPPSQAPPEPPTTDFYGRDAHSQRLVARNREKDAERFMTTAPLIWRYQRDHLLADVDRCLGQAAAWENTNFPALYEGAKAKLAQCVAIDECSAWKDQAAALAAYAKQTHDDSLFVLAKRIQLRAYRRAGELLQNIPPAHGANQNIREGDLKKVTRESAATEAGLSEHQRRTALVLAAVDEAYFNSSVESEHPPTVTQMASEYQSIFYSVVLKRQIPQRERWGWPRDGNVTHVQHFASFCEFHDPCYWAGSADVDEVRHNIQKIRAWLDKYEANLPLMDIVEIPPEHPAYIDPRTVYHITT